MKNLLLLLILLVVCGFSSPLDKVYLQSPDSLQARLRAEMDFSGLVQWANSSAEAKWRMEARAVSVGEQSLLQVRILDSLGQVVFSASAVQSDGGYAQIVESLRQSSLLGNGVAKNTTASVVSMPSHVENQRVNLALSDSLTDSPTPGAYIPPPPKRVAIWQHGVRWTSLLVAMVMGSLAYQAQKDRDVARDKREEASDRYDNLDASASAADFEQAKVDYRKALDQERDALQRLSNDGIVASGFLCSFAMSFLWF